MKTLALKIGWMQTQAKPQATGCHQKLEEERDKHVAKILKGTELWRHLDLKEPAMRTLTF